MFSLQLGVYFVYESVKGCGTFQVALEYTGVLQHLGKDFAHLVFEYSD